MKKEPLNKHEASQFWDVSLIRLYSYILGDGNTSHFDQKKATCQFSVFYPKMNEISQELVPKFLDDLINIKGVMVNFTYLTLISHFCNRIHFFLFIFFSHSLYSQNVKASTTIETIVWFFKCIFRFQYLWNSPFIRHLNLNICHFHRFIPYGFYY